MRHWVDADDGVLQVNEYKCGLFRVELKFWHRLLFLETVLVKSRVSSIPHGSDMAGLLPAATERFVKLNQALVFVVSRLSQREFGLK